MAAHEPRCGAVAGTADNPGTGAPCLEAPVGAASPTARVWPGAAARYLICFAMLPNLPLWLLARREGVLTPGWFSPDGLVLGVAALYVRPSLLFPLIIAYFLLDITDAICHTYGVGFVDVQTLAVIVGWCWP